MAGAGKPVIVFMEQLEEAELMYKIYNAILTSIDELRFAFNDSIELADEYSK